MGAVLDTNVFVSACTRPRGHVAPLWRAAQARRYRLSARRQMMDFRAGCTLPPRQDFPGPAYSTLFSEPEQFNLLRRWKQLMAQDD
jgi:hypothetical protein